MSRTLLMIVTLLLGLLTVALASMQFVLGTESPIYAALDMPDAPALDSNMRFFAGMGLGLGLILIFIAPRVERHTTLFRAVWLCAFLGGIGRAVSWTMVGTPPLPMMVFTLIELPLVPVLIVWQTKIARQHGL